MTGQADGAAQPSEEGIELTPVGPAAESQQKQEEQPAGDEEQGGAGAEAPEVLVTLEVRNATNWEKDMSFWDAVKLFWPGILWSMVFSASLIMEGYDTALLGSFYEYPEFSVSIFVLRSFYGWLEGGSGVERRFVARRT